MDIKQRLALMIFGDCETQWEVVSGGMGPPFKWGLRYEGVRAVADAYGVEWDLDLLLMIRECEAAAQKQEFKRVQARAAAQPSPQAARG